MAVTNLNAFKRRLNRLAELPKRRVLALQRVFVLEGLSGVLDATPVDSGRLRSGWDVTISTPSTRVPEDQDDRVRADKRDGRTTSPQPPDVDPETLAAPALAALTDFNIIHITNNTEYAEVVELGQFEPKDPGPSGDPRPDREGEILVSGGYSLQAPAGMLRNGLLRIAAATRRASGAL